MCRICYLWTWRVQNWFNGISWNRVVGVNRCFWIWSYSLWEFCRLCKKISQGIPRVKCWLCDCFDSYQNKQRQNISWKCWRSWFVSWRSWSYNSIACSRQQPHQKIRMWFLRVFLNFAWKMRMKGLRLLLQSKDKRGDQLWENWDHEGIRTTSLLSWSCS